MLAKFEQVPISSILTVYRLETKHFSIFFLAACVRQLYIFQIYCFLIIYLLLLVTSKRDEIDPTVLQAQPVKLALFIFK